MKRAKTLAITLLATTIALPAAGQTVGIATNPQGSLYYRVGAAIAKLMNEKLHIKARVQPYSGSSTYIPLVSSHEVQMGLVNVSDSVKAPKGLDAFKGRPQPNLRVLNVMFALPFSLLVPADLPIKTLAEVKGHRIPTAFTSQTTIVDLQAAALANAGLKPSDVEGFPVPNVFKGVDVLGEGKVDAAMTAAGIAAIQKASIRMRSHGGVRFVPINTDPAALARMSAIVPSRPMVLKPAKYLPGIVKPTPMMAFLAFLTANDKMSDATAYKIVKMLHDSKPELVKITKALNSFNPKEMTFKFDATWHPGAIKYYKEIGEWPPK